MTDASDKPFTLNVAIAAPASSIVVSPGALPVMRAGAPFSQSLSATGGIAPYSFALDSGSLPPGLTFAGHTISGTPTRRGSYSFAVKVTARPEERRGGKEWVRTCRSRWWPDQ